MKITLQKRRMDRAMVKAALTALLLAVSAVPALAQITTLESVNSDGVKGDRGSWHPSISADGRYVAFVSEASNLVPGSAAPCLYLPNPVSCRHVYVRDRLLGITTMISTNDAGEPGNGNSAYPSISGDGRFIAFNSQSNNLVDGDPYPSPACTYCGNDVFVHDRDEDENGIFDEPGGISVTKISDLYGDSSVYPNSISGDGRFIVYESYREQSLRSAQVYLYDLELDTLQMISTLGNGKAKSYSPAISADGSIVAYVSLARMVADDTNGDLNEIHGCVPGTTCGADIYVWNRITGETTRVSVSSYGEQANGPSFDILSLSADGRHVAFASETTNLVDDDGNGTPDVFVHDRQTGETVLASRDNNGTPGQQGPELQGSYWPSLSADGRFVAFESWAGNLTAEGFRGAPNVFMRDILNGETSLVSATMNGEASIGGAGAPSLSGTGRFVAFWSSDSNLAPGDNAGSEDIFVRDMFPNGCPGGEQDTGSQLAYTGYLLMPIDDGGLAHFLLSASLSDSAQEPVSGEDITFTLAGTSGPTTFDCGPTDSDGQIACDIELTPDVYSLSLYFAGSACNSPASDQALLVVYDPNQPRATGGGFFYPDAESTQPGYGDDKAHFGFVAYINKLSAAAGNLEFQYQAVGINLKSTLMTWYTVSANRAMFQGEATINGGGLFTFRVQAIDGDQAGLADHFDIAIWEGTDTEAAPIHRAKDDLAGGNILVRKR